MSDNGVTCRCGKFTAFDGYTYAHWDIDLFMTCECGRKWRVNHGIVEEEEMEIKIGDTIFLRPEYGLFQEYAVVGETSRSWLVRLPEHSSWSADLRIPKTLKGYTQGTEYDAKLLRWALNNRRGIAQALNVSMDASVILQCARLLKDEPSLKTLPPEVTQ
jgi:hypothetical protein